METGSFLFRAYPKSQAEQVEYEFLEGFYYAMQHQIVLKLVEGHPGRVELSIWIETGLWKQGDSFLEPIQNLQAEQVEYEFLRACIM